MFSGRGLAEAVIGFCYHSDVLSASSLIETWSNQVDKSSALFRRRGSRGACVDTATAQADWHWQLSGGLCVRGHIRHFELFGHVVSESPWAWSLKTRAPTRWFWRPANSLAMEWYFAELICLALRASGMETPRRKKLVKDLELKGSCGSVCESGAKLQKAV